MPTLFAVASDKGGTGRTTASLGLAALFAMRPVPDKVALVDLDPAGYATLLGLGQSLASNPLSCSPVAIPLRARGVLELFPAGRALAHASASQIRAHISRAKASADLVIIDTPPTRASPLVGEALHAATHVVSPVLPDFQSYSGFTGILADILATVPSTPVHALLSRWEPHTVVARSIEAIMRRTPTFTTLTAVVPRDKRVVESMATATPVPVGAPRSRASAALRLAAIQLATIANI
ncbi:MAG TPA: ParA family protein, partial [Gemmatimonadaceae bacterium]